MNRLSALFLREWRIARRIGGSGAMGVVFFLILVATYPFAPLPRAPPCHFPPPRPVCRCVRQVPTPRPRRPQG